MMNTPHRTMNELFGQLGLPDDDASINGFICQHGPMDNQLRLSDAPFWTDSQAAFLKEKLKEDGDWSQLIDSLSSRLREPRADGDDTRAANEGEGNVTAARRYNAAVQDHLAHNDVTAQARQAEPASRQQAYELREAEAAAAAKARH